MLSSKRIAMDVAGATSNAASGRIGGIPALRLLAVVFALAGTALAATPSAWSAVDSVTLVVTPSVAAYGTPVELTGSVTPPAAGETVEIAVQAGDTWQPVGTAITGPDGAFRLELPAPAPGNYRATVGAVVSEPVSLTITPRLTASLRGQRVIGATLRLSGRLEPAEAGTLSVTVNGTKQVVDPGANGSFRISVPATRIGRLKVVVRLAPMPGFEAITRNVGARVAGPTLRVGSHGAAVQFLERRLAQLRYALLRVDGRFGVDTADAVLAFRKVRGLARVSSVDRAMWRALMNARPPQPRVRGGDHIEVDKSQAGPVRGAGRAGCARRSRLHRGDGEHARRDVARLLEGRRLQLARDVLLALLPAGLRDARLQPGADVSRQPRLRASSDLVRAGALQPLAGRDHGTDLRLT